MVLLFLLGLDPINCAEQGGAFSTVYELNLSRRDRMQRALSFQKD